MGFDVRLVTGPEYPADADLVIPHVDLSVLPDEYRPILSTHLNVANRRITDIRKRSFSRNLVSLADDYEGPVIVKTDLNSGGFPEKHVIERRTLKRRLLRMMGKCRSAIRKPESAASPSALEHATLLHSHEYPVLGSKHELPEGVFANRHLIVEKYLPETDGRFYYTRSYWFFGSGECVLRMKSEARVVKGYAGVEVELVPVDERIRALRREMGFDYGKFDYVMHDGQPVLLDINTTPTFGGSFSTQLRKLTSERIAAGIRDWFPEHADMEK